MSTNQDGIKGVIEFMLVEMFMLVHSKEKRIEPEMLQSAIAYLKDQEAKLGIPTLLDLMQNGCEVTYPSGYTLTGDPETKYIGCSIIKDGLRTGDGVRVLNEVGVRQSVSDAEKFASEENESKIERKFKVSFGNSIEYWYNDPEQDDAFTQEDEWHIRRLIEEGYTEGQLLSAGARHSGWWKLVK